MNDVALSVFLACAGFAVGRWLGVRYEPGAPHYLMALFLAGFAVYLVWASPVRLDPRWVSLTVGSYLGLSLGSFLRRLWGKESEEPAPSARSSYSRAGEPA